MLLAILKCALCRQPALVQAFAAVAEAKQSIDGVVKVSAYEELDSQLTPGQGKDAKVDLMIFPAGAGKPLLNYLIR